MPDEPALDRLVRTLTAAVGSTGNAQMDVAQAETSASDATQAAADFGRESDVAAADSLRADIGQQVAVLAGISKTLEELLHRAVALQGGAGGAAPASGAGGVTSPRAGSNSVVGAAVSAAKAKHAEKRAKKKRQIAATRGDATTRRRLPSTEAMSMGVSSATATSGLLEGLLPQSWHSGVNAALGVAGAAVAGVGWVRYKRGAKKNADRPEG